MVNLIKVLYCPFKASDEESWCCEHGIGNRYASSYKVERISDFFEKAARINSCLFLFLNVKRSLVHQNENDKRLFKHITDGDYTLDFASKI